MTKQVKVVKGEKATGEVFAFRVDAKTRVEVGEDPVSIDADVADVYVSTGHLEIVETATKAAPKAEPKKTEPAPKA